MPFSYEEVRSAAVTALLEGPRRIEGPIQEWHRLLTAVAEALQSHSGHGSGMAYIPAELKRDDADTLREVTWDLFRQGYLTLGRSDHQAGWPFFTLSRSGRKMLSEGQPYRFTDTASYIEMVKRHVPDLDLLSITYLAEAVEAFHSSCLLASNVMLGVAAEHRFNQLLDALENRSKLSNHFQNICTLPTAKRKIDAFNKRMPHIEQAVDPEIREGLSSRFTTIQEIIRVARNDAGHPTGKAPDRETTYVYLQLYAPFARKAYQIEEQLCP